MTISRLYNFPNVPQVMSGEIDAELNQLVNESNLKLGLSGGTISGNLTVTGTLSGARTTFLLASGEADSIIDSYVGINAGPTFGPEVGITMQSVGSLIGLSVMINCITYVSTYSFTPVIRKNGSTFVSGTEITLSATGIQTQITSYARNSNIFANKDRLALYIDSNLSGTTNAKLLVMIEVQLDT